MKNKFQSLFDSVTVGDTALNNRIVMAPMTRNRASLYGVLSQTTAQYYGQRATAGLIVVIPRINHNEKRIDNIV